MLDYCDGNRGFADNPASKAGVSDPVNIAAGAESQPRASPKRAARPPFFLFSWGTCFSEPVGAN